MTRLQTTLRQLRLSGLAQTLDVRLQEAAASFGGNHEGWHARETTDHTIIYQCYSALGRLAQPVVLELHLVALLGSVLTRESLEPFEFRRVTEKFKCSTDDSAFAWNSRDKKSHVMCVPIAFHFGYSDHYTVPRSANHSDFHPAGTRRGPQGRIQKRITLPQFVSAGLAVMTFSLVADLNSPMAGSL